MRKPNIVLIMADQLAPHFLPSYGHRVVVAPHISRMADEGVTFDWAYTNSPLCGPSRYVMMTSCLPARIGAWDNAAEWSVEIPTFAHYLADRGYLTCLSGKMHFIGPDQLHGFEERLTTDTYPADFVWHPRWDQPYERQDWFHTMKVVIEAGSTLAAVNIDYDDEVTFRAQRWIYDRARSSERPFMLTISFIQPHDPYLARPETWNLYEDDEIDMPVTTYEQAPPDPHSDRLRWSIGASDIVLSEQQIRAARRAYYASVSDFDRRVGLVRQALDETGLADDTIVVITSDHGDMLGERGMWFKMSFLERSVRVPLIFWCPDRLKPRRVTEAVSLVDLGPTLVGLATDRADIDYPTRLDGRALLPHLYGDHGHDEVIGEYYAEGALNPMFMVQREGAKYVVSEGDPDQVFNVKADPEELSNLAGTEATLAGVKEEISERWDSAQLTDQVVESQRRRAFVSRVMRTQGISWDFTPRFGGEDLYIRSHLPIGVLEEQSRFPRYKPPDSG
ncbi:MAG: choline-sulfatase [Acidimicrobiia bacterium]|nr:choline-sulfatase [bacterium]MXX45961.1 choline-sulfatase [Acidimicrobiia bacterium]MDE0674537.1 choline-sulfatase [bacterium]MXY75393.1 choline-sulfatase [Acidimicrobiia bacterium]MYA38623.1 choline-sulfatase [Acidimicrobiia bacterium]